MNLCAIITPSCRVQGHYNFGTNQLNVFSLFFCLSSKESFAVPDLGNSRGDFCMQMFSDTHLNVHSTNLPLIGCLVCVCVVIHTLYCNVLKYTFLEFIMNWRSVIFFVTLQCFCSQINSSLFSTYFIFVLQHKAVLEFLHGQLNICFDMNV